MSIVKMKRLRLVGLQSEQDRLLSQLQHLGCVEISQPAPLPDDPEWACFTRPDMGALAQAAQARDRLESALATLHKYAPEKKGLLQPKRRVSEAQLFDPAVYDAALADAQKLGEAEERIAALQAERSRDEGKRAVLAPWLELDIPLDAAPDRYVDYLFGAVGASAPWETVEAETAAAAEGLVELTKAGRDRELQYFFLVCHKQAEEQALQALKPYGFVRINLQGWTGTARENLHMLEAELARIDRELAESGQAIAAMAGSRPGLQLALERARQEVAREENKDRLLETGLSFFLEGWLPAGKLGALEQLLGGFTCAWETRDPTQEEYPDVPVQLKNNAFSRPMNMVTEMYSLPAYDGLDPNPLMAPFFILFYGIMMADMAYGLIMIIASLVVIKKVHPKGTMGYMFALMGQCGVTTFVMGALTGGFFGDFIPQLLKIINPASEFQLPYLFTPLEDTMAILIGSLVLGFIQEITGMAISFVKQTKDGHFLDALFNEGTWWVIFAGVALAILGIGTVGGVPVVLALGGVMLVVGCLRQNPSIKVVGTLVGAIYNGVTGVFQDVLSYSRLMALMLSGSIIASVFNTLGAVTGNVAGFVIISMFGNALNFALNILGCFVHDLRLQCLEYFGKFYKDGGKPFKPLAVQTKLVDVVKEEQ